MFYILLSQQRPGYQKFYYIELIKKEKSVTEQLISDATTGPIEEMITLKEDKSSNLPQMMSMRAYKKWKKFRRVNVSNEFIA